MKNPDGTIDWPHTIMTPVDKVAVAMAEVLRARIHVDLAVQQLSDAIQRLVIAARGGHI